MKTVYKYRIEAIEEQELMLPRGAEPLHVDVQAGTTQLWALVDKSEQYLEPWHIRFAGTGHPIDDGWTREHHVGSLLVSKGLLVFHVFAKRA